MRLSRRSLLSAALTTPFVNFAPLCHAANATTDADFELRDLPLEGERALGRRMVLVIPRRVSLGAKLPLLVLLHGLGETSDQRTGSYAWTERYGLRESYLRLVHSADTTALRRPDSVEPRLDGSNPSVASAPFVGCVMACPYTPNVNRMATPHLALNRYARWIVDTVVPTAQKSAESIVDATYTALDGCSLGGYVGLEVFLRHPDRFSAWGGVQTAISRALVPTYAQRLETALKRVGRRPLHLETSSLDPFRQANEALAKALSQRSIYYDLRVLPGPHDQPWLRDSGTAAMLSWHSEQYAHRDAK